MLKPKPFLHPSSPAHLFSLLKQSKTMEPVKQIHSQMLVSALHFQNHLLCKLVDLKNFSYASIIFSQIPCPNDFSFNIMIRGLSTSWRNYPLTLDFYLRLLRSGEKPSKFTYPFIFIAAANLPSPYHGLLAHSSSVQRGLDSDLNTQHSLITMYARCGYLESAWKVFDEISERDVVSWNAMISGCMRMGYPILALDMFQRMRKEGFVMNGMTTASVLAACGEVGDLNLGRKVVVLAEESGVEMNSFIWSALIDLYGKCGNLEEARQVFDGLPSRSLPVWNAMITGCDYLESAWKVFDEISGRDVISWNAMISGCMRIGYPILALELFQRMRMEWFVMNGMTTASVLVACREVGDLDLGKKVVVCAEESGVEMNSFIWSTFIDLYGKCGNLEEARQVFDGLTSRSLPVWNVMITGYSQNGKSDEAIKLFNAMRVADVEPDKMTLVGVLSACGVVGALELGRWLDDFALKRNLHHNIYVGTALIDMHAKCGNVDRAITIFRSMPCKNIVSWNAMISGLAFHGKAKEAISLFTKMMIEEHSLQPNDVTFIGVLTACVHTGLVPEGRQWFHRMKHEFGIAPKIEHYSCMVDLLARAGNLEEAWDLTKQMPEKPDAVMLGALLCACRKFRNIKIGELIARIILELEPSNSGNYVISSKIYARSNRWNDSARMRELMRDRGVCKTPGCSWIEVDNEVFEFHAGEGLLAVSAEIHQIIEVLVDEMKKDGYSPNSDLV